VRTGKSLSSCSQKEYVVLTRRGITKKQELVNIINLEIIVVMTKF